MFYICFLPQLYHTKNYQGTTTNVFYICFLPQLYHTKNYQGTTTYSLTGCLTSIIIPYQELPGNYNLIFPFLRKALYYTIPRTTRELQLLSAVRLLLAYYTIPRTTRELQPGQCRTARRPPIIPYQELPGNYNSRHDGQQIAHIIPYQELPGNYNSGWRGAMLAEIIPYQELPGNYNNTMQPSLIVMNYTIPRTTRELQLAGLDCVFNTQLYHTKNYQGTTTSCPHLDGARQLYHTKNYQGTTTPSSPTSPPSMHYTIPRTTRELQPADGVIDLRRYYTIAMRTLER